KLNNELHQLPPDGVLRRKHLLSGLCRLVGACVGVSVISEWDRATGRARAVSIVDGDWVASGDAPVSRRHHSAASGAASASSKYATHNPPALVDTLRASIQDDPALRRLHARLHARFPARLDGRRGGMTPPSSRRSLTRSREQIVKNR